VKLLEAINKSMSLIAEEKFKGLVNCKMVQILAQVQNWNDILCTLVEQDFDELDVCCISHFKITDDACPLFFFPCCCTAWFNTWRR
jgi:hypothetical protein